MDNLKGKLTVIENGATSLYIFDKEGYIAEGNSRAKIDELVNRVNNSFHLKNIDLTGISKSEQAKKVNEEMTEFFEALKEYIKFKKDKNHVLEEFWDDIQAKLGLLEKYGITATELMEYYPQHLEKLKNRPRKKK